MPAQRQRGARVDQDFRTLDEAMPEGVVQRGVAVDRALNIQVDVGMLDQQLQDWYVSVVGRFVDRGAFEGPIDDPHLRSRLQEFTNDVGVTVSRRHQQRRMTVEGQIHMRIDCVDVRAGRDQPLDFGKIALVRCRHDQLIGNEPIVSSLALIDDSLDDFELFLLFADVDVEFKVEMINERETVVGREVEVLSAVDEQLHQFRPFVP